MKTFNQIFDIQFWRERLEYAKKLGQLDQAIGRGFEFEAKIDPAHQPIVEKEIKPDDKVLDIGCGYGRTAHWFKDEQYTGIDFVPEFIETAKELHPKKVFRVLDLRESLPFADKEFDWGVLISIKGMIIRERGQEEWDKIEKELIRVCKKVLVLEYGNNNQEEAKKYEII